MGKKSLLKPGPPVSREHFSSGKAPAALAAHRDTTRCVVRVLEAADLLASDAETGKSDPVCYMWIGHREATPVFDLVDAASGRVLGPGEGVLTTAVVPTTINPVWNSDHIFLLGPEVDAASLMLYKLSILVRDEDLDEEAGAREAAAAAPPTIAAGTAADTAPAAEPVSPSPTSPKEDAENKTIDPIAAPEVALAPASDNTGAIVSYDPLGSVEISFKDIFRQGKKVNGSAVILGPIWKPLQKFEGMRRVEGRIKLSVSIIFSESDLDLMRQSLGLPAAARATEVIDALQRRVDPSRPLSAGASSTASLPSRSVSPSERRSRRSPSPGRARSGSSSLSAAAAPVTPIRPRSAGTLRGRGALATASTSQQSIPADNISISEVGSQSDAGSVAEYYDGYDVPLERHPLQSDLSAIAEDEASQLEQPAPGGGGGGADATSQPTQVSSSAVLPHSKEEAAAAEAEAVDGGGSEPLFPLLEGGDENAPPPSNLEASGANLTTVSPLESPVVERQTSKEARSFKQADEATQGKTASRSVSARADGSKVQRRGEQSKTERRSESGGDEVLSQLREQLVLAANAAQKTEQTLRELEALKSQLQQPVNAEISSKVNNPSKATKKLKDDEKRALAKQRFRDSLRQNPPTSTLFNGGPGMEEFDDDAGVVVRSKGRGVALVVGEEPPKKAVLSSGPVKQEVQAPAALTSAEIEEEELVVIRPPEGGGDEDLPPDSGDAGTAPRRPSDPDSTTAVQQPLISVDSKFNASPLSPQDSDTVLRYPYRKEKKSRGNDAILKQLEDLKFSTNSAVDQLMNELSPVRNSAPMRAEDMSKDSAATASRVVRFGGESSGLPGKAVLSKTAPGALQSMGSFSKSDQDTTPQPSHASSSVSTSIGAAPIPSTAAMPLPVGRVRRSDTLDWDKITAQIKKYLEDTRASLSSSTWSAPAPGAPQPRDGTARPPAALAPRLPAGVVQDVLQRGFPDDVARLAQIVSTPVPEQLSTSHRNLMFESFAYLLSSDECRGQYDAIVMPWLMALVQYRLVPTLTRRVQQVLVGALRQVAGQRSEVGVWASRLEAAIAAHGV